MDKNYFSLLGIPVENQDIGEVVEKILRKIEESKKSKKQLLPKYITSLDLDFLFNIYGFGFNQVKNQELFNILSESYSVSVADKILLWLSRCLENTLKDRIAGADILPLMAEMMSEKKMSIYFLGDSKKKVSKLAYHMQKINPGLKVAGFSSSFLPIKGVPLAEARDLDLLVLTEINRAKPDVLVINFHHQNQEIWFERVKKDLQAKIVIGINERAGFGSKSVSKWLSFFYYATPLIIYHRLNLILSSLIKSKDQYETKRALLFVSQYQTIAVWPLPKFLTVKNSLQVEEYIEEAFSQDIIVLDFQNLKHIDLIGLGIILNAWKRGRKEGKKIIGFGIKWHVWLLLKFHRIWPAIQSDIVPTPMEVVHNLESYENRPHFYQAIYQKGDHLTVSFLGELDATCNFENLFKKCVPMFTGKHCVLDFTYCSYVDNLGISFLLNLKELADNKGKSFKITGLTKPIYRQFRFAEVDKVLL